MTCPDCKAEIVSEWPLAPDMAECECSVWAKNVITENWDRLYAEPGQMKGAW